MGGLVTCLQSAHYGRFTMFLTPEVLRGYLREDENGSPQAVEPGRIGPLPSLRKLLIRLEILPPVA